MMSDNQIKIEKLQSVVDIINAAKDNVVALLESIEKVTAEALVDLNSRVNDIQTLIDDKVNKIDEVVSVVEEDEEVIANVFEKTRDVVGVDENFEVDFSKTQYLKYCTNIIDAITRLDYLLSQVLGSEVVAEEASVMSLRDTDLDEPVEDLMEELVNEPVE